MNRFNKIVWSEGLFLRPQLFQQQERYLEQYAHRRASTGGPFFWGFRHYEIQTHLLALGQVGLAACQGVFLDGTPFDLPADGPVPAPFQVLPAHVDAMLCLAVSTPGGTGEETTFEGADAAVSSLARFAVFDAELRDSNSVGQGPQPVQMSHLRTRIMLQEETRSGWIGLPLARVRGVRQDGCVELDPDHLPPLCGFGASPVLAGWLKNLHGICRMRAESLALRLSASDGQPQDTAEISDFLLLQILNRHEPLLEHVLQVSATPPEQVYTLLRGMCGELSSLVRFESRRPLAHAAYRHDDLQLSFQALVADVSALLNDVLVRSARRIPLLPRAHNVLFGSIEPDELRGFTSLVLSVGAHWPAARIAGEFPARCKLAPVDRLADVIRAHIPGIGLLLLPVPPRQLPFQAGQVYFQVEPTGLQWEHLLTHGGLAMHIANDIPGLRVELWGVRRP
ncbi:type VI secretion system baseplate subunit TssK [Xylophilus sp. Kf1]|nr:type VI secretion system baseplate subunit TssK [Xylophilus sp. Kf1]